MSYYVLQRRFCTVLCFRYQPKIYVDGPDSVVTNTEVNTVFTFPSSTLDFFVHVYSNDGKYLGFESTKGGFLQLCSNTDDYLNEAYQFGTKFKQNVS